MILFWIIWKYVTNMPVYSYVFRCVFSKNYDSIFLSYSIVIKNQELNMDTVLIIV